MNITLYSTKTCPMCKGLKQVLDRKNIEYKVCEDTDLMISNGISKIPVLEIDGEILSSADSIKWANAR